MVKPVKHCSRINYYFCFSNYCLHNEKFAAKIFWQVNILRCSQHANGYGRRCKRLFGAMTRLSCQHHRHCHQPYHRLAIFRPRPRKMPNAFAIRPSLTILTGQQSPFPAIRQALALSVFRLSDHASMTAGYWRLPPQASRSSAAKSH